MAEYTPEQLAEMKNQMEQLEALSRRQRLNESEAQQLRELQRKLGIDIARSKRDLVADAEKQLAIEKELLSVADNAAERIAGRIDVAEAEYDLQRNKLQLLQAELEALYEADDINEELVAKKMAELQHQRDLTAETKRSAKAIANVEAAADRVLESTLGISDAWENTLWGSILTAEGGVGSFGDKLKSTIGDADKMVGSLTASVIETSIAFTLMEDSVLAQFNKATMAGTRYDKQIQDLTSENRQIGASMEDVAGSVQNLHLGMSRFTFMTKDAQNEMANFAIGMEVMGVSSATTTEFLDNAMLSFGKSGTEAMEMQENILGVADALGVAGDKMMQDFIAATPRMAEFGAKGEQVFKELAAQAKATGVEVGTLIGIAEGFDTYESAAQSVGQLNAIMGGPLLNTTEMLLATDSERIDMLVQSMEAGELQWNQMNRFQKKAVANAAGITDMAQAEAMFSRGAAGLREHQAAVEADRLEQERQEQMQRANVEMMHQLMLTLQDLAVSFKPILDLLKGFAQGLSSVEHSTGLVSATVQTAIGVWGLYRIAMKLAGFTKKELIGYTIWQRLELIKLGIQERLANARSAITAFWTKTKTTVTGWYTAALQSNWLQQVKDLAIMAKRKIAGGLEIIWKGVLIGKEWLLVAARTAGNAAVLLGTGLIAGLTGAMKLLGITQAFTAVKTWAFNAALYANPIGLIVLAVVGLIAVFVLLAKKFGSVKNAFNEMGAAMKKGIAAVANFFVRGINVMVAALNTLSVSVPDWVPFVGGKTFGFNLRPVAYLAEGTADFAGGQAVVGEHGPELVTLPPHSSVVNNQNTERIVSATQAATTAAASPGAAAAPAAAAGGGAASGPTTVILQMSDREVGRVVIDAIRRSQVLSVQT